jgi:hypothetical protein
MVAVLFSLLRLLFSPGEVREIALENLALRQQLAVLKRQYPRPRLRTVDRLFWGWLSRIWPNWRNALLLVRPETALSWHQQGFRLFWAWISRRKRAGRPGVSSEVNQLIRKMAEAKSPVGSTVYSRRTTQIGNQHLRTHILRVPAQATQILVANLEDFPEQPYPGSGLDRFLHHSDRHLSDLVCIGRAGSSSPAGNPLQRDGAADGLLDRATDAGGVSRGYGTALPPPGSG